MATPGDVCSVEAYSGAKYGEAPRAFTWRGVRREVVTIERAWREPQGPRFLVRTSGGRFTLCYDEQSTVWTVVEHLKTSGVS